MPARKSFPPPPDPQVAAKRHLDLLADLLGAAPFRDGLTARPASAPAHRDR